MGVVHRDLRPENFYLSSDSAAAVVKLAGFGRACPLAWVLPAECDAGNAPAADGDAALIHAHREKAAEVALGLEGSDPRCTAPEVLAGCLHGPAADAWACGVLLFRLLSGEFPFEGATAKEARAAVLGPQGADFSHPVWWSVSEEASDLVRCLLHKDPEARMGVDEILAHPWMVQHADATARPREISRSVSLESAGGAARLAALDRKPQRYTWGDAINQAQAAAETQERCALLRRRSCLDAAAVAAAACAATVADFDSERTEPESSFQFNDSAVATLGARRRLFDRRPACADLRDRREILKDPLLRSYLADALETLALQGSGARGCSPAAANLSRANSVRDIHVTN